jgi:ubiquinone biosynthesis O-methyltransferase
LARLGGDVLGIDACKENIEAALQACNPQERESLLLKYRAASVESLPEDNLYDLIAASEVIEHVADAENFLKSCAGKLKPGGMIFLSTINSTILSNLLVVFAAERMLNLVPIGTHDPAKFLSIEKLERIVADLGSDFCLIDVQGVAYFPPLKQWRKVPSTAVNYFATIKKI